MRLAPNTFDTPDLYTTPWTAPYGAGLTRWRHGLGWEDTPAGAILALGLEQRGLTESHVSIATSGRTIMISWPDCIGEVGPVVIPAHEPPSDPRELQRLLDLCTASVARETLMRHAGGHPAAAGRRMPAPPQWSLLTTPITEAVLATVATDSYRVWSLAREDGEFEVTLSPFGVRQDLAPSPRRVAPDHLGGSLPRRALGRVGDRGHDRVRRDEDGRQLAHRGLLPDRAFAHRRS